MNCRLVSANMFCFISLSSSTVRCGLSELTVHQLPVKVAQCVHEVFTGFLWQVLPGKSSFIFVAAEIHTQIHTYRAEVKDPTILHCA